MASQQPPKKRKVGPDKKSAWTKFHDLMHSDCGTPNADNAEYNSFVDQLIAMLTDHGSMNDVFTALPLGTKHGGQLEPFHQSTFNAKYAQIGVVARTLEMYLQDIQRCGNCCARVDNQLQMRVTMTQVCNFCYGRCRFKKPAELGRIKSRVMFEEERPW